jgi:hypothetical protein
MTTRKMSKVDFEMLARFRYQLRRFLRFSEEVTRLNGVTPLQYQLMLQIKGFPGREWATVAELASSAWSKWRRLHQDELQSVKNGFAVPGVGDGTP